MPTSAVLVFALRLHYYSRMQIFGALVIFFFLEIFLYGFYVVNKKEKSSKRDVESIEQVKTYLEKEKETFDFGPKFKYLVITSNNKKDSVKGFNDGQMALDYFGSGS